MRHSKYLIFIILGIIILLSSCALFPSEVERHLFFDSICWEDDSHILMYTMVRKWVNTSWMSWGSETGYWDWSQGEIWRINVFTGEKELLLRREGDYYTGLSTPIKIDVLGDRKLISLDGNAYIMEGESADWQEILGIYEAEWVNENEIIGIEGETGNVIKYNLDTEIKTIEVNPDFEIRYFNYFSENDLMIYTDYSEFIIKNSSTEKRYSNNDTLITIYNDTLGTLLGNTKAYRSDSGYIYHRVNIDHNVKFIKFDDNLDLLESYSFNDLGVIPRSDFDIFLYAQENSIEILDKDHNIVQTVYFELDQL